MRLGALVSQINVCYFRNFNISTFIIHDGQQLRKTIMQVIVDNLILIFSQINLNTFFLPKPKNWEGLTVVNVRAVKNPVQLHKNVVQNHITIGKVTPPPPKLIKIGIYSSAATLKVVIKGL